jgi:UDP-N-acetylmuramyl tripeptide synthase
VVILKLSLIKFYEGNNIKRKKRIIKAVLEEASDKEVKKFLTDYFKVCFILGFEEKLVDIERGNNSFELWVTYSEEELSRYVLKNLACEKYDIEKLQKDALKIVTKGFSINIAKEARDRGIPVIGITEDTFQLGYGKNSVIISKDYQSYEKTEVVKLTQNMRILWQYLSWNRIPKVDAQLVYCSKDIEKVEDKLKGSINIKSIDKELGINVSVIDSSEFLGVIDNMLHMYGRVFVCCGGTDYRIICFKGKAGLVFKHNATNDIFEETSISLDFERIVKMVYQAFPIEFMYIDVKMDKEFKVVDLGCVFSIGNHILEIEKSVIDYYIGCLKDEGIGNIPIISVTGTNGKTTTVRLVHYILNRLGFAAGLTSTGGIFVGEAKVQSGDTTGFLSAREVLMNKNTEAAVFETARGGITKNGLGYEMAKASIITSLSEDHIGMEGIKNIYDLADIKSVVLDEIESGGKIIIKAQEELVNLVFLGKCRRGHDKKRCDDIRSEFTCCASTARTRSSNVSMFSIEKNEYIEEYIENGGEALYMEDDYIIYCRDGVERKLLSVKTLPFTHYGYSKGNILNIMAAVSAAYSVYPNLQKIIETLKDVRCDLYFNPGRQNIIDIDNFKLILDYGHNSEAFEEVLNIARSLKPSKITSIIAAPGDRMDKYIEELGSIAAKYSDHIIIREQKDLRGRKPGESAAIIKQGILKAGFNENNIEIIYKEEEAIVHAMKKAEEQEVIVLFTQCLDVIIPALNDYLISINKEPVGEGLDFSH